MSFFLKNKLKLEQPVSQFLESPLLESPRKIELSLVKADSVPKASAEGLAIALRLSNQQVVVPRAFRVTAQHFSLQGQALIEGSLNAAVRSSDTVEVLAGGSLAGSFIGNELTVSGQVEGVINFQKLHLHKGAVCKGAIEGRSLVIDEGALLEASCRLIA
jgi:cytoskeletal protein CcmA (bactofilin family)